MSAGATGQSPSKTPPKTPPKTPRPTPVPRVRSALVDALAASEVASFWDGVGARQPLVEPTDDPGQVTVTFCWRDAEAAEVLLFANRLTDETSLFDTLLEQLPGSDLWHASFRMGSDWRASYCFLVRGPHQPAPWILDGHVAIRHLLDRGVPDPRNAARCRNRAGADQSVVSLPGAEPQPWLAARAATAAGRVTHHVLADGRDVWWWDPPGVADDTELRLVVALDGDVWTSSQSLPTTLDNLLADGEIPPVRVLLPSAGDRAARWSEMGAGGSAVEQLVSTLLPWAEARGGVRRGDAVVVGQSLGALTALRAGLLHPELFSAVVAQSASLWQSDLAEEVAAGAGAALRVHLTHGSQEWILAQPHRELADRLRAEGVVVEAGARNGGHDYAWWRGAVAEGLRWSLRPDAA